MKYPAYMLSVVALMTAFSPVMPAIAKSSMPRLEKVANFDHEVTGVTVTENGRIFVNFPRWTEDSPISVAEVGKNGSLTAYPDKEWNGWRNAKKNQVTPGDHWVCVQSVFADQKGSLWVLDPAAPATEKIVPGGPKLVQIDLASNTVKKTYAFDDQAAPVGSYLNDLRLSPDSKFAYITDSGKGALVVLNLETGKAHRVLDGDASTAVEKDVVVKTDGKELRRPDGRTAEFAADGIALSADGAYLYWQALTGKTLYRAPVTALQDANLKLADISAKVEKVGENGVADGLWIDKHDVMYISAPEENAVKMRKDGKVETLVQDKALRWPDTFAQGPDDALYITSSRIMDNAQYNPKASPQLQTTLWRIPADHSAASKK